MNADPIVVGMSGGVDSAVAAYLLKKQGYDVIGVFMKNWDDSNDPGQCSAADDFADVRSVCDTIGMPYYTVNFTEEYQARVFSYFLDELKKGRTPNPDVLCNCEIKFKAFLDFAMTSGASSIATGHYCRLSNEHKLLRGIDGSKDQSYFLAGLKSEQLLHVLFPIGSLYKKQVREIAFEQGLSNAGKKDSTGICFIGERKFRSFIENYLPAQKGEIVDERGRHIGFHDGLMYYTLGQRRGLGIGGRKGSTGESWFVIGKDLDRNLLIVQQGEHEELYSVNLISEPVNWIDGRAPASSFHCTAKFRYRQPDQQVSVQINQDGSSCVAFDVPQRAVTPGQWVVFYDGEICLGGAPIESTTPLRMIRI